MSLVVEKYNDDGGFNPGPPEDNTNDIPKKDKPASDALPSKPSALIRKAIADLEFCEAEGLTIHMEHWYWRPTADAPCEVCLAGAVMARSLKLQPGNSPFDGPHTRELRPVTIGKLKALNDFRCGGVHAGLKCMGLEVKNQVPETFNIKSYAKDPEAFKNGMKILANTLEFHGY